MKLSVIIAVIFPAILLMHRAVTAEKEMEVFPVLAVGTNTYKNARILRTTETEAFVKFDGGIIRAKLAELPKALQEKYPPTVGNTPKAVPPPVVYQRVPIDLVIRNLETQISVLENTRKRLQNDLSGNQNFDLSSESDRNKLAETNRRAEQIDRAVAQVQLQLNRLRAARDRTLARGSNAGGEAGQGNATNPPSATNANVNGRTATSAAPNLNPQGGPAIPNSSQRPGNFRSVPYRR